MTATARGSDKRLGEMIVHALNRRGRRHTSTTWLANFLFLADLEAYGQLGRSISGKTYRKTEAGPRPTRLGHVLAALQRSGAIAPVPLPKRDARGRFAL